MVWRCSLTAYVIFLNKYYSDIEHLGAQISLYRSCYLDWVADSHSPLPFFYKTNYATPDNEHWNRSKMHNSTVYTKKCASNHHALQQSHLTRFFTFDNDWYCSVSLNVRYALMHVTFNFCVSLWILRILPVTSYNCTPDLLHFSTLAGPTTIVQPFTPNSIP